jgi:hypothetical protein
VEETVKEFKKKFKFDKEIRKNNAKLERELYFIVKETIFELEEYARDKFMESLRCGYNRINDECEYQRYVEIRRTMYRVTSKLLNDMQEAVDKYSVELGNRIRETIKDG